MTVDQTAPPAAALLDAAERMAPEIAARADEIEAARTLPRDLVEALAEAGMFGMLLPASHGGAGLDLPAALPVLSALSRADASVGWTVMIGAGSWCDLTGLPRASFDAIYGGSTVITGGAISPSGSATAVAGGYRVHGRWAFVSGCRHADWFFVNCVEDADRLRVAALRAEEVEVEDTWHAVGLCGTGSHHLSADVVVPPDRTYALFDAQPCVDVPLPRIPPPALYALAMAGVAVGVAEGALADVRTAAGRTPLFSSGPLAANPLYQHQLATADTRLRAARTLLHADAARAAATAEARAEFTAELRAELRATAVWTTTVAEETVTTCYRAGGGAAVYRASPLQRRLRDINAVTQHFLLRQDTLTTSGAVLAGQHPDLTMF